MNQKRHRASQWRRYEYIFVKKQLIITVKNLNYLIYIYNKKQYHDKELGKELETSKQNPTINFEKKSPIPHT